MIGQKELRKTIDKLIEDNKFPRFVILVGLPGSGRGLVARYVADTMKAGFIGYSCGVDDMRAMISNAYKITSTQVFYILDADKMSPAAKNCILKVTEEPPQNAHFILAVSDLNSVLDTIRSRGTVMYMNKYSADEIVEFVKSVKWADEISANITSDTMAILSNVCETPGDACTLLEYNPIEFSEYVEKVADHLEDVSIANMFKISAKIKLKETQEGYDLRLFWRMFVNICLDRLRSNPLLYGNWVRLTTKKLQELQITGVNKSTLFDSWLVELKEVV